MSKVFESPTISSGSSLSRRAFTGLVGGGAASLLLAGSNPAFAQTSPKRGGVLRVATHTQSTNDTFDSTKFRFLNDYIRGMSFYSHLTVLDAKSQAVPSLAESWDAADGGRKWIFKLVKGVRFHDGSSLTPTDVIYSIMRHKNPDAASTGRPLTTNIDSIVADGPETVVFNLLEPDADLPVKMSVFQFTIVKDGTTDFSKPNGTGPFKLREFKPGVLTAGIRNENYWRNGHPYLDGFEMIGITDSVARVNALLAGDVDVVSEIRGPALDAINGSSSASLFKTSAPRFISLQSTVDIAPMTSQDLRLAMALLVDRQRFLDVILRGNGRIANDHPIMSDSPLYNASLPQRMLDPDKAKFHIKRADIGSTALPLYVSDTVPFSVELGQLMQRQAQLIGFNLQIRREPADSYYNNVPGKRAFFANSTFPRATYDILLNLIWKSNAPWNESHFYSKDLDALIDRGRMTLDADQRHEIYGEIQKTLYDAATLIVPSFMDLIDGVSNKVKGLTPVPVGNLGGCDFTDNVWLDA